MVNFKVFDILHDPDNEEKRIMMKRICMIMIRYRSARRGSDPGLGAKSPGLEMQRNAISFTQQPIFSSSFHHLHHQHIATVIIIIVTIIIIITKKE